MLESAYSSWLQSPSEQVDTCICVNQGPVPRFGQTKYHPRFPQPARLLLTQLHNESLFSNQQLSNSLLWMVAHIRRIRPTGQRVGNPFSQLLGYPLAVQYISHISLSESGGPSTRDSPILLLVNLLHLLTFNRQRFLDKENELQELPKTGSLPRGETKRVSSRQTNQESHPRNSVKKVPIFYFKELLMIRDSLSIVWLSASLFTRNC